MPEASARAVQCERAPRDRWRRCPAGGGKYLVILLFWFCCFGGAGARGAEEWRPERHNILVLHSYDPTHDWTTALTRGIRAAFDESACSDCRFIFEFLDAKRHSGGPHLGYLAQVFRAKYAAGAAIDLIICCDDPALHFLFEEATDLFPGVPVVFCGANEFDRALLRGRRPLAGVLESVDAVRNVELIRTLCPWAKEVLVVTDPYTQTAVGLKRQIARLLRAEVNGLRISFTAETTPEELGQRLRTLNRDTVVLMVLFGRDRRGRDYTHEEAMRMVAAQCAVPVFGVFEGYLGQGMVGGLVTRPELEGRRAGGLAVRLLAGEPIEQVGVIDTPAQAYMFDWRELQRFGIDMATLPIGSQVLYREATFLERYGRWLGLAVLVMLLQACLIGALLVQRWRLRRAQGTLLEKESALRHVLDLVPHYIYACSAGGDVVLLNQATADALGRPIEDIVGQPSACFTPDLALLSRQPRGTVQGADAESQRLSFEQEFTDARGRLHWATMFRRPLEWRGHAAVLTCGVDVTEKRQLEEQLRQSQKMEAVGCLAGGVAHDFNNLLQVILGYAPLLKRECRAIPSAAHKLEQISRAGERAMGLVRQLLAFSRREAMRLEPVDVTVLVRQLTKMLQRLLGRHIETTLNVHGRPPAVLADSGQLEQVLMNLCVNARDAMPRGGRITIDIALQAVDADWCRTRPHLVPGDYLSLAVQDTGCGMSPELRERIFEPFFTTKKAGQGTGLGLATVYAIVRRHGGHIEVESRIGVGTTFHVYLPVSGTGAERRAPQAAGGQQLLPGGCETVLLAEDGDLVRDMTQSILEDAGYRVITATDGHEALACVEQDLDRIDLLVLDMIMPGCNGREVYETAAARRPGIPVLFTSGYSADLLENDYLLTVPGDLLQKPYTEPELLERIRALLDAAAEVPHDS